MILKIKTISLVLFFAVFSFVSILWASDLGVPLPKDAVKVLERSSNFGPIKSFTEIYKTSLNKARVLSFYKKAMAEAGWKQKQEGIFIKDKYMVAIVCGSEKNKTGEIEFNVTISNIPTKEEFLGMRKADPDKLIYMPIYPASEQLFLLELPFGMASAYEADGSIEEVAFFYKSGMLNYGWKLYDETPIAVKDVDCPECKKLNLSAANKDQAKITSTSSRTKMVFRRGDGETCIISMFTVSVGTSILTQVNQQPKTDPNINFPSKTNILVTYNANKSINP